jgi:hypothetical protein
MLPPVSEVTVPLNDFRNEDSPLQVCDTVSLDHNQKDLNLQKHCCENRKSPDFLNSQSEIQNC